MKEKIKVPRQKRGRNANGDNAERIQRNHISFTLGVPTSKTFYKPLTESNYPPIYRLYYYCGCTKETLVPDMDTKDCRQLLITVRCILGNSFKFNHRTVTKNQVECIKDKIKRFISDPLEITGEKKISTAQ